MCDFVVHCNTIMKEEDQKRPKPPRYNKRAAKKEFIKDDIPKPKKKPNLYSKEKKKEKVSIDPLKAAERIVEVGGLSRIEREAEILMLDWAIRFPLMTPYEFLTIEKGYSVVQANAILHETGGTDDWHLKRVEIQNKVTETVVKRHVDQIADMNDTFIKASKIGMAKGIEMLSKLGIDAAKDEHGKLIIDPKTKKPVYRGFRSIDLLNVLNSLKISQEIWRKGLGINESDSGMSQLIEKVTQLNELQRRELTVNNTQINLTVNPIKAEAEQKIETFIKEMSYEDIRSFIDYHKKSDAIEVESKKVEE